MPDPEVIAASMQKEISIGIRPGPCICSKYACIYVAFSVENQTKQLKPDFMNKHTLAKKKKSLLQFNNAIPSLYPKIVLNEYVYD